MTRGGCREGSSANCPPPSPLLGGNATAKDYFFLVSALFSLAYPASLSRDPLPLCFLFLEYRDELKKKADRQLLKIWMGLVP